MSSSLRMATIKMPSFLSMWLLAVGPPRVLVSNAHGIRSGCTRPLSPIGAPRRCPPTAVGPRATAVGGRRRPSKFTDRRRRKADGRRWICRRVRRRFRDSNPIGDRRRLPGPHSWLAGGHGRPARALSRMPKGPRRGRPARFPISACRVRALAITKVALPIPHITLCI